MAQTKRKIKIAGRPTLSTEERLRILKKYAGIISPETGRKMLAEVKKMRNESEVRMKKLERQWQSYQKKKK